MVLSASWGVLTVGLLAWEQLQQQREWLWVPPGVWRLASWFAQAVLVLRFEELPAGGPPEFPRMPSEAGPHQLSSQTSGTPAAGSRQRFLYVVRFQPPNFLTACIIALGLL